MWTSVCLYPGNFVCCVSEVYAFCGLRLGQKFVNQPNSYVVAPADFKRSKPQACK